ncbi:MAG: 30S ribosomal protein S18 [Candidatus Omnitrophica bacterium]|nr:30S ribosomal protein S18 [Candidatus Omnitrophota bacterium]
MARRKLDKKKRAAKPRVFRKKSCRLCLEKTRELDFKNAEQLYQFITEKGKIMPRRITGACAKHQRIISQAVKRARVTALMPFAGEG